MYQKKIKENNEKKIGCLFRNSLSIYFCFYLEPLLLDTCFLTCQITEIEDTCPPYASVLVDIDLLDKGWSGRKNPFHANVPWHFADGERFGVSLSTALDNDSPELLNTLFIPVRAKVLMPSAMVVSALPTQPATISLDSGAWATTRSSAPARSR